MPKKWRIIFYPHLHPLEPRAHAETQFTNRRICIFTKHKRHNKRTTIISLYHEVLHIFFRWIFHRESLFDEVFDNISYHFSKIIQLKNIVKEKGWNYYKNSSCIKRV